MVERNNELKGTSLRDVILVKQHNMPVEVRELIITARVEDKKTTQNSHPAKMQGLTNRELEKIVALCAEQVMEIIKRQTER